MQFPYLIALSSPLSLNKISSIKIIDIFLLFFFLINLFANVIKNIVKYYIYLI